MAETPDRHAEMLGNRIRKTLRRCRRWARRVPTDAYRVYDRDIPEVPLMVDVYGEHLHVADARFDRQLNAYDDGWLDAVVGAAAGAVGTPPERVHVKSRHRQRGTSQYERLGRDGETIVVSEHGLRFEVNLDDYLDTGLFLDHRPLRALLGEQAAGRAVLNLFAYTGSFTVHALAGGATSATTIDLSNTYLAWGRRNLELNGIADERDERVQADTFEFLREATEAGRRWDIVIVDPPTFSNSKRFEGTFDVQRDHVGLLRMVMAVTAPGGEVWFSTNRRRFSLGDDPSFVAEETTSRTVPEDFAQKRPHRSWRLTHPPGSGTG